MKCGMMEMLEKLLARTALQRLGLSRPSPLQLFFFLVFSCTDSHGFAFFLRILSGASDHAILVEQLHHGANHAADQALESGAFSVPLLGLSLLAEHFAASSLSLHGFLILARVEVTS